MRTSEQLIFISSLSRTTSLCTVSTEKRSPVVALNTGFRKARYGTPHCTTRLAAPYIFSCCSCFASSNIVGIVLRSSRETGAGPGRGIPCSWIKWYPRLVVCHAESCIVPVSKQTRHLAIAPAFTTKKGATQEEESFGKNFSALKLFPSLPTQSWAGRFFSQRLSINLLFSRGQQSTRRLPRGVRR